MSIENRTLLSAQTAVSANQVNYNYSDKAKGAGYNKNTDGLCTVVYDLTNFVGKIRIQGTLELYPGDADWFDVASFGDFTTPHGISTANIVGKFVWIRAAWNLQSGLINEIRYSF